MNIVRWTVSAALLCISMNLFATVTNKKSRTFYSDDNHVNNTAREIPINRIENLFDTTQQPSPRNGKYLILSYGSDSSNPLKLGYFSLSDGTDYKYYDMKGKLLGDGKFLYDPTDKEVKWQNGPFKAIGWNGKFQVKDGGKNQYIQLNKSTIGVNSGD